MENLKCNVQYRGQQTDPSDGRIYYYFTIPERRYATDSGDFQMQQKIYSFSFDPHIVSESITSPEALLRQFETSITKSLADLPPEPYTISIANILELKETLAQEIDSSLCL